MVKIPNIPIRFRQNVRFLHSKLGSKKFFSKLNKLDPIAKKHIKTSDTQRAIRAYEIKLFTKKSMYDWFKNTKSDFEDSEFYKILIDYPRDKLIKRINSRTENIVKNGGILEVKKFIRLKISKTKTAHKAIGIKEIKDYLNKSIQIHELIEKISIKTRQYAKRQTTWARGNMMDWNKIKSDDLNKFLKKI